MISKNREKLLNQLPIDREILNSLLRASNSFFEFIYTHTRDEIVDAVTRYNDFNNWPEPRSFDLVVLHFLEQDVIEGEADTDEINLLRKWSAEVQRTREALAVLEDSNSEPVTA